MEGDRPIDRACGVLTGVIGILGCMTVLPIKQQLKEAFQISMAGIGISLSILSIISKTTNNKSLTINNNKQNGQKN